MITVIYQIILCLFLKVGEMLRYELFPLKTCCILGGAGKPQYSSPFNHAAHCSSFVWFPNLITYVHSNKTLLLLSNDHCRMPSISKKHFSFIVTSAMYEIVGTVFVLRATIQCQVRRLKKTIFPQLESPAVWCLTQISLRKLRTTAAPKTAGSEESGESEEDPFRRMSKTEGSACQSVALISELSRVEWSEV